MDIREIRIDQFGCWKDVIVQSMPVGMNLIHLDDGGEPAEFANFLFGVLFGFEGNHRAASGGAIVLDNGKDVISIDRQISSRGQSAVRVKKNGRLAKRSELLEEQAQSGIDPRIAGRFFFQMEEDLVSNWNWLSNQTELCQRLLDQKPKKYRGPQTLAAPVLHVDDSEQRMWEAKQNRLTKKIEERSLHLSSLTELSKQRVTPKLTEAEIDDELRMLQGRLAPLRQALGLVNKWQKWKKLRLPENDEQDVDSLRSAFTKYRAAEKQKRQHERVLKRTPSKTTHKKNNNQQEAKGRDEAIVCQLLRRRDWVLRTCEVGTRDDHAPTSNPDKPGELRFVVGLIKSAQEDCGRAELALRQFTDKAEFDWTELEEGPVVLRSEIAPDSPLAIAPLSEQLEELKRRRIWIEEEHQYLLAREPLSSQVYLWIVILFVLSISALFGTLVVESQLWQFVLLAVGLGGAVSSGAIKMSLEKRAVLKLRRTQDRLQQIDREIASIAEDMWDEEEAKSLAEAREQQRFRAMQLQQAVVETNRRLESAELAYREMLIAKGMSPTLSPELALQQERHQAEWTAPSGSNLGNPKLDRWVSTATKLIQRVEGECYTSDPAELVVSLEMLLPQLRDKNRSSVKPKPSRDDSVNAKRVARQELERLDKLQHKLLRRMKVHDVYELESAIEKADRRLETRQEWEQLDRDLRLQFDVLEDGFEIRELLETYGAAELQRRVDDLERHRAELVTLRKQHDVQSLTTSAGTQSELQIEIEELNDQLLQAERNIQNAIRAKKQRQEAELTAAKRDADKPEVMENKRVQFSFLTRMTGGQYDTIRFENDRWLLGNLKTSRQREMLPNSEEARLAWLALSLRLATMSRDSSRQPTLPLVLRADDIFSSRYAADIHDVLKQADFDGLQIVLLSGTQTIVNQLVDGGVPVVRIGLHAEHDAAPIADDDWSLVDARRAA